ncbi:tetratricopeptide repeat protein [Aquabacter sp. L1I39]|uniref:tetratricopeptide repeat protein n=1 Tax=Aquabacter sp. L1I39 TaxID=2820278 RepID=UPI001ADBC399|nr:tetratricopeptide repeat protein [Aquabacter sp. L1I39]QTL01793.1 tetratricopeptide repeat protein [Aquabacter sp. L1I39]
MQPDPRLVLAQAASLHRSGQVDAAIEGFRQAARLQPSWPDPHRMLAMALLQSGRAKEAVQSARTVSTLMPNDPHAHLLLGVGLMTAGQADKAISAFERAIRIAPRLGEAQFQAGNALAATGRFKEAVARYDKALEIDPLGVEALVNRAVALARLKRRDEALGDLDKLIGLQPWAAMHHVNKAALLLEGGEAGIADAIAAVQKAIEIAPKDPDAWSLLGQARLAAGDIDGARAAHEQAVAAAPERADLRVPLVQVLRYQEVFAEARGHADAAIKLAPRFVGALYERAEVLRALDQPAEALADIDALLALEPRHARALVARAIILQDMNRAEEGRAALDKAARLAPEEADVRLQLGQDDLARGRWEKGWIGYEARGSILPPTYAPLPFTRWDGKETPERLVVLVEQGYGDAIQFARLIPLLADRGVTVRFLTRAPLVPLFRTLDPRIEVSADLDDLDLGAPGLRWVPLGSLPRLLARDPATWPAAPYLTADPERIGQWRHVREEGDFLVGITWQGSTRRVLDIGRSAPLAKFAPLAQIDGVRLVTIQRGAGSEQLDQVEFRGKVLKLDEDFDADGAFLDTAALLQNLDLVVTTDTSMAHLAGALAVPTLVALRAVPDWRWGRAGAQSIFYPSLELVRQRTPGDWDDVFARIADLVRARIAARGTKLEGGAA